MIIAITGGTGFIGKKLALRHLELGDEVRVLTRRDSVNAMLPKEVLLHFGDLHSGDSLLSFIDGVDVLYHCAGEIRNASRMYATHVEGTQNLIDAAKGRIRRWVQLSSVGAYGQYRAGVITESTLLNPSGEYEITKVASDALVESAALNGAFNHVILRPSNVYGAAMSNQSLFGLIKMIKHRIFFFIGTHDGFANYIHVDNVVEALVLCATKPQAAGQVYNVSDCCSLANFVAIIAKSLGVPSPRICLPELLVRRLAALLSFVPKFPLTEARVNALTVRSKYVIDKIAFELGYKNLVTMEEGLEEVVKFWLKSKQ